MFIRIAYIRPYTFNLNMTANFATIEISLKECLLPSEVSGLIAQAEQRRVKPGEVIVLAVRDFLARQANPQVDAQAGNQNPSA